MLQDLHSHTYYSLDSTDSPDTLISAAIKGGIQLLGISDHIYGIAFGRTDARLAPSDVIPNQYSPVSLQRYFEHLSLLKEKYSNKIRILRGVEVATYDVIPKITLPASADISFFDYCLIEQLSHQHSITNGDLFSFAKRCGTKYVGVAHTDMFAFINSIGEDPLRYFSLMAEHNIFWEMNVNYDSIHGYQEHPYMLEFFKNKQQQDIVRKSGVRLSVGFDSHRIQDYLPQRVADFCNLLTELEIKMIFEE